jgi:hypothetical protein
MEAYDQEYCNVGLNSRSDSHSSSSVHNNGHNRYQARASPPNASAPQTRVRSPQGGQVPPLVDPGSAAVKQLADAVRNGLQAYDSATGKLKVSHVLLVVP